MSPIDLAIFISRVESLCAEMGAILQRAAFSPNIKDRLDFSCALFDAKGELFAQAAHIPVHLGSMAFAMHDIIDGVDWQPGDMLVLNDPFLGGTHLPDVTVVAPYFFDNKIVCFVVNRAHHANIGAATPGSMPLSNSLYQEGLLIPPTLFVRNGEVLAESLESITGLPGADTTGDFAAQISANRVGLNRLDVLLTSLGLPEFERGIESINEYGESIALSVVRKMPVGHYSFQDVMDDDGFGHKDVVIKVSLEINKNGLRIDFAGSSDQVEGNINCPLSVAAAAVFYVFRCLLPKETPNCAGVFKCISIVAPLGSIVNAQRPAATAAGNVETSMRICDVILGALSKAVPDDIPAASQGTMNNIALGNHSGNRPWDYYETLGGGMGAHRSGAGLSAVQCHMTNTLNTPIESLESHYPLRILEYSIRRGSGGEGLYHGGEGLVRQFLFLESAELTLLTERRVHRPWGLAGGSPGRAGENRLDGELLPGKCYRKVRAGQVLRMMSPGGGGYGEVNTGSTLSINSTKH